MRNYFVKTPWWLKKIYSSCVWSIDTKAKELYLTFDDGPHPVATPFVLDVLKQHNAKASFFCIGKNVKAHPEIYHRILAEGHSVGNHTQHHLNGWKTDTETYLADTAEAARYIGSTLFRPPYGRIKKQQIRRMKDYTIVMWDVLSGDFDIELSKEKCAHRVLWNARPGSVVVFHDSEKAFPRLEYALPATLAYFSLQGYTFRKL
jgi:peptidoglycan-N-acetylglucosamine deacetylase